MTSIDKNNRDIERALDVRREILHEMRHGRLSRREMHRRMLFAGGALAALAQLRGQDARAQIVAATASTGLTFAPPTTPFREELVHVNRPAHVKQPQALTPEPTPYADTAAGGVAECRRDTHQAWNTHWANLAPEQRRTYLMTQQVVSASLHPELPPQQMWGFDGKVPGPTFHSRYGVPAIVRIVNQLPDVGAHKGYGCPETSTHLHNGHTPWESDGNPEAYFPRQAELSAATLDPGRFRDHHYPNMYAGNDPREALGTLWYHDHRHDFTAPNVYRGLAGFHLLFDELDSGNENDANPRALRLPSGEYDVPLMCTDRFFNSSGVSEFDQFNFDGIIGNKYLVNGKVQPFFRVEPRKYRLRILNPGVSRTYGYALMSSDSPDGPRGATLLPPGAAFVIGTGGNLLPAPLQMRNVTPLGGSQRLDIVVDFAKVPGRYIYLVNRYVQTNGRQPEGYQGSGPNGPQFDVGPPEALMRFDKVLAFQGDPSRLPATLRPLPWDPADAIGRLSEAEIVAAVGRSRPFPGVERVRSWEFGRANGMWTVNGNLYDGDSPSATAGKNTAEIWVLTGGGSWVHPIHLHFEEHRTLFRSGVRPRSGHMEQGRDDTMLLGAGERGILFRRFRDFTGRYVMHCHNVVHEDHAMMIRFDIQA